MEESTFENRTNMDAVQQTIQELKEAIKKRIVGQEAVVDQIIIALLADGHVLLEGVPGIAKTRAAKTMADLVAAQFGRIQFTPDLMPSDVLGTSVFNMKTNEFEFKKGPVFTEVLLIDEINRAPAKTQAALFEVMEERQVSIDGKTNSMNDIFFVLATQNPVEQEGTYRLPEAQLDRFVFKVVMDYPDELEEVEILKLHSEGLDEASLKALLSIKKIQKLRDAISKVVVEEKLLQYISSMVQKSRVSSDIFLGASPRASISIMKTAKVKAAMSGRDFVIPEDIQFVTVPVMRHRIILSPEREMEGLTTDEAIATLISQVEVPK